MAQKSTTVRTMTWGARRLLIKTLNPLTPAAAADLAAEWFLRPERGPEPTLPPDAEPFEVSARGLRIAGHTLGDGPAVVLAHGWNGSRTQLEPLARALVATGHRAVLFDQPGHGASQGPLGTIPDMAAALEAVTERVGGARAVIAHSLGAAAAVLALSRRVAVERLVLVAPPLSPHTWIERFAEAVGLSNASLPLMHAAITARAGMSADQLDGRRLARAIDVPVLVVHDRDDRQVPLASGTTVAEVCPDARMIVTRGLGHNRILRDPAVVRSTTAFATGAPFHEVLAHLDALLQPDWEVRDEHLADMLQRFSLAS